MNHDDLDLADVEALEGLDLDSDYVDEEKRKQLEKEREAYEQKEAEEAKEFEEIIKRQVECFKAPTAEEKIKKLGKKVAEAEKKHSNNLRKLREIEKKTKRTRTEMIEEGTARLKKMTDMDELELRALSLAKKDERRLTRNFYKGAPNLLINDERISPGAKAVFWLLQSKISNRRMRQYPTVTIGIETVAAQMGVSYKTAKKYLKELRDFGWLGVERRGKQLTNRYVLFGIKTHDFNMMVKMKGVDLKIMKDSELNKKLTSSLEK